jgi:tetratricopeptide (TPR) repeat protein
MNVRYLVDGDVGPQGQNMVVNLSIIDAATARQIWSGRVETAIAKLASSPGLPAIRATEAVRLAALYDIELPRISKIPQQDRTALEHALSGWKNEYDGTAESLARANASCDEALRLDPKLLVALECKAALLVAEAEDAPTARFGELARHADDQTRSLVSAAPDDPMAWSLRAMVLADLLHQWSAGFEANARAIQLDPSRTANLEIQAIWLVWTGRAEEAMPVLDKAMDQSTGSVAMNHRFRCRAFLALGRFKDAVESCERSASEEEYWIVHVYLAIAYAQLGDLQRAAAARERVLRRRPDFTIDWYRRLTKQFSDSPKQWEQWEANLYPGLHKAGFRDR